MNKTNFGPNKLLSHSLALTLSLSLLAALTLASCKTSQDIKQEEQYSNLSLQLKQSQNLTADTGQKFMTLEQQVRQLQGQIEELQYNSQKGQQSALTNFQERLGVLDENVKVNHSNEAEMKKRIEQLETKMSEQQAYLEELLTTLKDMIPKSSKGKKGKSSGSGSGSGTKVNESDSQKKKKHK